MKKTFRKTTALLLALLMLVSCSVMAFCEETVQAGDAYYEQGDYALHYTVVPAEGAYKGRILFLHGFLYSGSTWDGAAQIMSQNGYDCYLVDLPNYGQSTRENQDITPIDREELVVGMMQTIAPLDEWLLAGHSMGGGVALNIACDHPELKGLMLFCPSEIQMPGEKVLNPFTQSALFRKCFTGMFNAIVRSTPIVKLALFMVTKDWSYASSYDTTILTEPLLRDGTATGIFYSMAYARNTDLDAIAGISVPTLLVWADSDIVISQSNTQNITDALPDAEVHTVSGSHLVIETDPAETADLMLGFLK